MTLGAATHKLASLRFTRSVTVIVPLPASLSCASLFFFGDFAFFLR